MRSNAFGVILLLLAGFVMVHNLPGWWDLEFGDETTYLASGLHFNIPFPGGAQWGPIYAAWYAFWHLFINDSLDLYYFNWSILTVLSGVLVFLYMKSGKVGLWLSVWIAMLFLFSNQNLPLNPKISIFPFCLILGCLSITQFFETKFSLFLRFLLVAASGLLCAYARPEFYISFLIATVFSMFFLFREGLYRRNNIVALALFACFVIGLHLLFDNPMISGDGNRSAVAFQQHFVINYCTWNAIPQPETIDSQIALFHKVLGNNVQSITDALLSQPGLTLKHIAYNVFNSIKGNVVNVIDMLYHSMFKGWHSSLRSLVFVGLLFALILMIDFKKSGENFKKKQKGNIWNLLCLLILISPSLIATILVYPRTHYLVFHLIFVFWALSFLFNRLSFKIPAFGEMTPQIVNFANIGLITFFITVRYFQFNRNFPTPTSENIRFMTSMKPKTSLNILERHWYRVFLDYPTTWTHVEEYTTGDFAQFVAARKINFILMTEDMQHFFSKDAGFKDFENHHAQFGFDKITVNNEGSYLLVKEGVLK